MESSSDRALSLLQHILDDPGAAAPDEAEAEMLRREFPYMALPDVMRLREGLAGMDEAERRRVVMRVAVLAPGAETLFRLLDPDGDLLRSFMPPEEPPCPTATTTEAAIDTFLDTYGHMDPREEALLEKLIFNPVPDDYSLLLESEAAAEASAAAPAPPAGRGEAQDRLLDAFLESAPERRAAEAPAAAPATPATPAPEAPATPARPAQRPAARPAQATPAPASSLSESLAQVYIRRGRYDKAFDIIHALSLNNPKKSVYFADQLRFLQKLMLNEKHRNGAPDGRNNM